MLPFYGGYPDQFWSNDHHTDASAASYQFSTSPSYVEQYSHSRGVQAAADKGSVHSALPIPKGYPWIDVEVGGGMAAAYNHRVHMYAIDMPSMHTCFLGAGVNMLGYYMYHGGNNPHSLVNGKGSPLRDAPNTTMQESSFQPAGAQNELPSESYDFFAPLGEFGQPRPHYHSMRRLHLLLRDAEWGATVVESIRSDDTTRPNDPVRWAIRSAGASSASWLFVNNHERAVNLSTSTNVQWIFKCARISQATGKCDSLSVPSAASPPISVVSPLFFCKTVTLCGNPAHNLARSPKCLLCIR